jgi:hypothetical protein
MVREDKPAILHELSGMKQLKKSVRIKGLCPEGNKILDLVVWDKATFEQIPK